LISLVKIAHIGSTQGKSGALKFYPEEHLESMLLGLEFIFLKINGSKVPFKVKKINADNDPWLLLIDKIDGPQSAQQFTNSDAYAEREIVGQPELIAEETMQGFNIISSEGHDFGKVINVEEHPQQILLLVQYKDKAFRIPFHPDLILDLNKENKTVTFSYSSEDLSLLFS